MDQFQVTSDPNKPAPHGHFLARSYLGGLGTTFFCWHVIVALVVQLEIIEVINVAYLTAGLTLTTAAVGTLFFIINAFYWGATRNTRQVVDYQRGETTLKEATPGQKRDRSLRSGGDQEIITVSVAISMFILIWDIWFYYTKGIHTFQPLSFSPDGPEIFNWFINKVLKIYVIADCGIVTFIALSTGRDSVRRATMGDPRANPGILMGKPIDNAEVRALNRI